ncbi:peptidyl-prolyl cis-trans isomerase [candidate division WOR-3 bacterium]|nr:peptidyl-prolyl cis-trans isomerase [candidate division WOR-3 bacterium]
MLVILALMSVLPQDYVNLVLTEQYDDAICYCEQMIQKNKNLYLWKLELGDIYHNRLLDYARAEEVYRDVVENYKHKDGWAYYRLAQVLEMREDFLNSARMYEIVATRYRKAPLDSFSLMGVERCFKKNYQDYVAIIDGYRITRLELDERTGRGTQLARSDEMAVLDRMITDRLIYASAVKHNVIASDFFKRDFDNRNHMLLLDEVRTCEVMAKAAPSEKQMKDYYKKNRENFKVREQVMGKEIVVESDSLAQVLLDTLNKDVAAFDSLAKQHSIESTARNGGLMGVVYPGRKPAAADSVIFKTEPNTLSGIITFDGKYGIYYITSYKPEQYRAYDEVVKQIEPQVRAEKVSREEEALNARLRKKAKLVVYEDSIVAVLKDATDQSREVTLAEVNGRPITWSMVLRRNEAMIPQFAKVDLTRTDQVQEMINTIFDDELRLELAWRNKYFLHDGYFTQLKETMKTIMDQALYQKVVVDAIVIDSQAVEKEYTERRAEFKVPESARVHEILVDSKELADRIHKELVSKPESFDSLAAVYSTASSTLRGAESGLIRKGMMGDKYDSVLFSLKLGEISRVFEVRNGAWTVIKLVEHHPEHYRSLDDVRHIIESGMKRQLQGELAASFLERIREEADIQILLAEPEVPSESESETEQ